VFSAGELLKRYRIARRSCPPFDADVALLEKIPGSERGGNVLGLQERKMNIAALEFRLSCPAVAEANHKADALRSRTKAGDQGK